MKKTILLLALLAINLYVTAHRIGNAKIGHGAKMDLRDKQEKRYKPVGSGQMTPVMVKTMEEQQEEINKLKIEIASIKSMMKKNE
jgi:hypothetical protein